MWHKPFLGDSKFGVNVLYSLIIGTDGLFFLFARKDQRTFSVEVIFKEELRYLN